jgi:hypothetical protein
LRSWKYLLSFCELVNFRPFGGRIVAQFLAQ